MGTLVFVCPATGAEVSTGIDMDLATAGSFAGELVFQVTAERFASGLSYSCGVAALFTGVKAETTETRSPDLEAASERHHVCFTRTWSCRSRMSARHGNSQCDHKG